MKKLLPLLVFLASFALSAQTATVEIPFFQYDSKRNDGFCDNTVRLTAFFEDGTSEVFYTHRFDGGTFGNGTDQVIRPDRFYTFPGKVITSIQVFARSEDERDFPIDKCKRGTTKIATHERVYEMNRNSCIDGRHDVFERTDGQIEHRLLLDYEISNSIDILSTGNNDDLGYDDPFPLRATQGFSATSYRWQFRNANGLSSWRNIPRPFIASALNFRLSQMLGIDESIIGEELEFRIRPCYGHDVGNIVRLTVLASAPNILRKPETTDVTCFGANDGTVTFEFDRPLIKGEQLALEIVDLSDEIGVNNEGETIYNQVRAPINNIADEMEGNFLTVTGLPASKPERFRARLLAPNRFFTDGRDHERLFDIIEPSFVVFRPLRSTDVHCFGGSDGSIVLRASGGTMGDYEYQILREDPFGGGVSVGRFIPFDNQFSHIITDLEPGTYSIRIIDGNGCTANIISDVDNDGNLDIGDEIIRTVTIGQPDAPLQLVLEDSTDASAAGFTDGSISVRVFGGTANRDFSYNVTWKDENGTVLTTVDTQVIDEGYFVTLRDIGVGSYFISVTDANHIDATQKEGCEITDTEFTITDPNPLIAIIEETNAVSCNSTNEFNDPFSDGELVAHAEGGTALGLFDNDGLPYYYTWKKEDENGVFQVLTQETDSILGPITSGRYSVNIEDANGIILGEYVNNILENPLDVIHNLIEPTPISIVFDKRDNTCNNSTEAWVEATISGGTGNYEIRWSNGETSNRIENLETSTYFVFITDENGCEATGQVTIDAPDALDVEILSKQDPSCFNATDGSIEVLINGGVQPYSFQWSDLDSTESNLEGASRNDLVAGTYSVTVTDVSDCATTLEIILENPGLNLIDLGPDRVLCGGQFAVLDATFSAEGTTYLWSSDTGFSSTSPVIEIAEAGTYSVSVMTRTGCSGSDSIVLTTSDTEIDAHFVVSSQAFADQEIALINISSPIGDSVEWFFPPEAEIVMESNEIALLLFDEPGSYDIILRSNQGECYIDFLKSIIVAEAEDITDIGDAVVVPFIEEFVIYPNPSDGNFEVDITLTEASEISLKLFNIASQGLVNQREETAAATFKLDYGVALSSGSYILLLETAKGNEIRKVLIQ